MAAGGGCGHEVDVYVNPMSLDKPRLAGHLGDDVSGDRIGHAESATEILEQGTDLVEKADHLRAGRNNAVERVPFADEAIGALASLDQRRFYRAGHVILERRALARDELVFHSGPHPEPHYIVGRHSSLPELAEHLSLPGAGRAGQLGPRTALDYVLNLKSITSPSLTTYSLPSSRA